MLIDLEVWTCVIAQIHYGITVFEHPKMFNNILYPHHLWHYSPSAFFLLSALFYPIFAYLCLFFLSFLDFVPDGHMHVCVWTTEIFIFRPARLNSGDT